jgi:virulence-associated protein VagC
MLTKVFQSENLLAVRIPKEMGFEENIQEVDIVRNGDVLTIRPIQHGSLKEVAKAFSAFPAGFMAEGREHNEQDERNWA